MHITLNGQLRNFTAPLTIARLLEETGYANRHVAVEVNREIISRSRHVEHILVEGDQIEIVHAMGGG